jgi:serine protease Do
MGYRSLRIFAWFAATAFLAIFGFIIAARAAPTAPQDVQQVFRIIMPDHSVIVTQDVTPDYARALNMNQPGGVLITDVSEGPLHRGDVILSVNGNAVSCPSDIVAQLSDVSLGAMLVVEVWRDGRIQRLTLQLQPPPPPPVLGTVEIRGITVTSLPTEVGVIVEDTLIGTPASDAGIKSGDIILDVDGHTVHSAEQFLEFLTQLGDQSATFNILQRNGQINVFVIPS